jgi:CTP:molybdopterin cytidylyltransferase MocA
MPACIHETAAMIPAAGNSGRMGIPKPLIKLPDGRTFLEQIVMVYLELEISPVIVVVNPTIFKVFDYRKPVYFKDVEWVINAEPEKGRMKSIAMGLSRAQKKKYCFIQNVDQPFASTCLITEMLRYAEHGCYIAPTHQGRGGHPLLVNRVVAEHLITKQKEFETLKNALEPFEKYCLKTDDPKVCENINTPEDYFNAFGTALNV